jgi:hypothetical protein
MTPEDDEVTDRILEGTTYDQAEMAVRRTFPFRIVSKIRVAIGVLALSGLLGPALYLSRNRVHSFGGTETLSRVFSLTVSVLALIGVVTTAAAGLLLVRQLRVIGQRSLSEHEARRLVRTEDVLMWFVLQGAVFVLIPVVLVVVGVVSVGAVETLYSYGVTVYQPSALPVDARLVSALGGGFAVVLYGLCRRVRG